MQQARSPLGFVDCRNTLTLQGFNVYCVCAGDVSYGLLIRLFSGVLFEISEAAWL